MLKNRYVDIPPEMDRYQAIYVLLVLSIATAVISSALTREETPSLLSRRASSFPGLYFVELEYDTGEIARLWLRREEGFLRLTVGVWSGKGSRVEYFSSNLSGKFAWIGLLTMRPLDAFVEVEAADWGYQITMRDIGACGLDSFIVDYIITTNGPIKLDVAVDVKRGSTLRHLYISEVMQPP